MKKSWEIVKNYKALWFLGFLSIIFASGGEYNIIANVLSKDMMSGVNSIASIYSDKATAGSLLSGLSSVFKTSPEAFVWLLFLLVIIAGLVIFILYIAINSQSTLIRASARILTSKKRGYLDFKDSWNSSKKNFCPVLSINILMRAIITGLFFIAGLPLLFLIINNGFGVSFVFSLLFILLVPVSFAVALIGKYAIMYNVLEDMPFSRSIASAWKLFKKNWILSLEMSFILFFINFGIGFIAIVIAYCLIMLPLIIPPFLFFLALNFIIAFLIMILSGSALNVFQMSAWTNLFIELQADNAKSKIERLLKR